MCRKNIIKHMKFKLMFQSLAPLAFLTIVKNSSFQTQDGDKIFSTCEFIEHNLPLLIIIVLCAIWVVLAVKYYLIDFGVFRWKNTTGGYEIKNVKEDKEASLNFFLTLIIPLLVDNISTIQGAATFALIIVIICILLYKTDLFYANPILTIIGYRLYSFEFIENDSMGDKKYLGLCKGAVLGKKTIMYKQISDKDDVLYIKEM